MHKCSNYRNLGEYNTHLGEGKKFELCQMKVNYWMYRKSSSDRIEIEHPTAIGLMSPMLRLKVVGKNEIEYADLFRLCPPPVRYVNIKLQSKCHYIVNLYVKTWHVRLGGANGKDPNMLILQTFHLKINLDLDRKVGNNSATTFSELFIR